jgi:hypothetical protein
MRFQPLAQSLMPQTELSYNSWPDQSSCFKPSFNLCWENVFGNGRHYKKQRRAPRDTNLNDFYIKVVRYGQFYDCVHTVIHWSMRVCQRKPHCYKRQHPLPQQRTEEDLERLSVSYVKKFSHSAHVNKLLLKKQRNMDINRYIHFKKH